MPEVKICGNRRMEDIDYASGADYLGFVIGIEDSFRSLTPQEAAPLFRKAARTARTVAVVKSTDMDFLAGVCSILRPDYVQLQLEADPLLIKNLGDSLGAGIIALVDPSEGAAERAKALSGAADMVHTDTVVGGRTGGTGRTHNWAISRSVRDAVYPSAMMLSGGLNRLNLREAVRAVDPAVVDVSSGVEREGWKSRELVSEFIGIAGE